MYCTAILLITILGPGIFREGKLCYQPLLPSPPRCQHVTGTCGKWRA